MSHKIELSAELALPAEKPLRVLYQNADWRIALVSLAPGGAIAPHSASGAITLHCLVGHADVAIGQDWHPLQEGDLLTIEKDLTHALRSVDGARLLLHIQMTKAPA